MRSSKRTVVVIGVAFVALVASGAVLHVGTLLARPVQHPVGPVPPHPPLEQVEFQSLSGIRLSGWFARGSPGRGGVVLLHGVRADRRSMLGRAEFLYDNGYSVLLVDLQSHGESEGEHITFGILESDDARSSVEFLRSQLPDEPIAVIGTSLGGAACLLGEPMQVSALVLEAVYPDVRQAVRNRLRIRLGPAGEWLAPLLILQMRPRLGIDPAQLRPVDHIPGLVAPVLIIAGEHDRRTSVAESDALFAAAPEPKQIWVVSGAAHVDFHRYAPDDYEARVLEFLGEHMRRTG